MSPKSMGANRLLYLIGVGICVIVDYFVLTTAIDTANLWLYGFGLILIVAVVRLLYLATRRHA